jgi:hypothetical protein
MSDDFEEVLFSRVGKCKICKKDNVDLYAFSGGEACFWCADDELHKQPVASALESSTVHYTSEDWLPEHGFDEED